MSYKRRETLKGALWLGLIVIAIINWPITCVFGVIYQIIYLLMMGGSLVFLFTTFIKSYDVDKDENRMSL